MRLRSWLFTLMPAPASGALQTMPYDLDLREIELCSSYTSVVRQEFLGPHAVLN